MHIVPTHTRSHTHARTHTHTYTRSQLSCYLVWAHTNGTCITPTTTTRNAHIITNTGVHTTRLPLPHHIHVSPTIPQHFSSFARLHTQATLCSCLKSAKHWLNLSPSHPHKHVWPRPRCLHRTLHFSISVMFMSCCCVGRWLCCVVLTFSLCDMNISHVGYRHHVSRHASCLL